MGPSIQESLGKAIEHLTGEKILPEAASRTDRGVHARGQVIHFLLDTPFNPLRLQRGLNAILPPDIRVVHIEETEIDFHPTLLATSKEYQYLLCLGPVQEPVYRLYSWHFRSPLDLEKMHSAADQLIGTHNFTSFANESEKDPQCTLEQITINELPGHQLQISIVGNRFLYKMARNLIGTLVYIGAGKLSSDCIPALLASADRKKAGITAPAHGLYLHQVFYGKINILCVK